jgi:hypothetical protein
MISQRGIIEKSFALFYSTRQAFCRQTFRPPGLAGADISLPHFFFFYNRENAKTPPGDVSLAVLVITHQEAEHHVY